MLLLPNINCQSTPDVWFIPFASSVLPSAKRKEELEGLIISDGQPPINLKVQ